MASFETTINAQVTHRPSGGSVPSAVISMTMKTIKRSTTKHYQSVVEVSAAVNEVVSFGDLDDVKLLVIQKGDSPLTFKASSTDGADQAIPVGRLLLLETQEKPITALKVSGSGEFEVFFATR